MRARAVLLVTVLAKLDRVRMQQDKPQVYGTQFTVAADGQLGLYPIEDAEPVDERRDAEGLPPMAEYEKKFLRMRGQNA